MSNTLLGLCSWLASTPLSQRIQVVSWIIPAVQSVHIICVSVVMGSVALIDLRLLNAGSDGSISRLTTRLLPAVWIAIGFLLVTGSILIIGEPTRSLPNPAFQTKMVMLLCVGALTLFFQRLVRGEVEHSHMTPSRRAAAKAIAITSLLLWVGIVIAGRWIAYLESP